MSQRASFFAELKRRNVYKVAVAYAVVGWLLVQVATQVFPFFEIPNWAVRLVVLILIAGFPVALIFSWAFEITPEGIKRESEIDPAKSVSAHTGRKIIALTITVAVIAAGLLGLQLLRPKASTKEPLSLSIASGVIPDKSIAVLPFDNLSHDPDNAYFAEGIQDEILTRLAKTAELKVIARSSTQRFKSSADLRQVAQQLGVANLLEGSVQKVNDQVRVNVQLIRAANEAHLWAEVYDRKLTDIFAVESEIARSVAEKLQAKLTGAAERVFASRPTEDPEAHQLYLKGRYFWNRRTGENMTMAMGYFQQAIAKDPSYALAYAGLADCYALLPVYSNNPPKEEIQRAIAAARHAIELDDSLAEAHTSLANALVDDLQFAACEAEFKRALELDPNYATAHQWYGESLQAQGRFKEAVAELQRAHELDPLSLIINTILASNLDCAGYHDEALQQIHRTLEMDPNFGVASWVLGQILENKGDLNGAIAAYQKAQETIPTPRRVALLACVYAKTGRVADARKILADLIDRSRHDYISSYTLAIVEVALGDKEQALQFLEKAYQDRSIQVGGNSGSPKIDPRLDPLRSDRRFQKLLAKFMGETS
jgi:serine/threonine-protein kinase